MRIHITGASGSGTSTLATALSERLGAACLDGDSYYWLRPEPPFADKRPADARRAMLARDLQADPAVLGGSIVGWGAEVEDAFDLIVFLYLDAPIRLARLRERELRRFGAVDEDFLEWAGQYDQGPSEGRSLATHRAWLASRRCPVLELRGDLPVAARVERVLAGLKSHG
ncbi:MAG TPA: AAA family ATPase [Ideonella sp.]|uniref:AAA family ATPase n=1 Tax=Ideonella sp. TaxID=1929293 RepID=UPI002D176161|nr:AAA family ATPase [Ideonella sp.]HSI49450.1 AAA family ATPase [Ideonella sp.]